jgi:polygalacturonase
MSRLWIIILCCLPQLCLGQPSTPILRVGDALSVTFDLGDKSIPRVETTIKEDGSITLLYNRHFSAINKTVPELESEIREAYALSFVPNNLTVTVSVLAHGSSVYVDGAVKKPGWYGYYTNMTVLEATAAAGGFTDSTAKHNVQLVRANGKKVLVDAAKAQENPVLNLEVFPGDRILVPQRWFAANKAPGIFDVRDFGAKGDGKVLDTLAIQKAIDECGNYGGGIVRLASGVYLSKPIYLRSKTILQIDEGATLKATDEQADYLRPGDSDSGRSSGSFVAFVNGRDLTDVAIVGKGTIDGSGERWWGPAKEAKRAHTENPGYTLPRPRMIVLSGCKNVRVEGVTLANSPCFHLVPVQCENVDIEDVTIVAPADSPNTDGIDPSMSRHVRISRCRIDTGDDNIAIKSGHRLLDREFACEDITVTDCAFLHGHGMSIGSETAGGVRNLTVRHCTFEGTANGIRIKSPRGRGGEVEDLTYSDITMTNVDPAITITCYYPKVPKEDAAQSVTAGTPKFHNIRISNLTATCPRGAGIIVGLPESPVSGVMLENVHISATTGLVIRNSKDMRTKEFEVSAANGPPLLLENAQVDGAGDFKGQP